MCGIVGGIDLQAGQPDKVPAYRAALDTLKLRGPDGQRLWHAQNDAGRQVYLGHARLSILDLSDAAFQPMWDADDRYGIIFNGEIFNYRELKTELTAAGENFNTTSDTEVLLRLYMREGAACISRLNGFFALAIYDRYTDTLLLARDRYGVKPLYVYQDAAHLSFASEMKALYALGIPRTLNPQALHAYLRFNYVPQPMSMVQGVRQVPVGHHLTISRGVVHSSVAYYTLPQRVVQPVPTYADAQRELFTLLEDAVQRRLVADVPVGVFLSGGIDSSAVAALAARHKKPLHTFSIGFTNKLYDETHYAQSVARLLGTEHTVFTLSEEDLFASVAGVLDYMDEPFADPSALNVYILSQHTRKHVTVALSGDGADELAGGYSKHWGEWRTRSGGLLNGLFKAASPLLQHIPSHRNSTAGRKLYQAKKYAAGLAQTAEARYTSWASVLDEQTVNSLLRNPVQQYDLGLPSMQGGMNDVLRADFSLVLPSDMLTKVDRMSMAQSLEVRTPFLDYRVVDYVMGLPAEYKINATMRKRIVQDAFRSILPPELYNRPKQGFEVPVRGLLLHPNMQPRLNQFVRNRDYIEAQGLFNYNAIENLWQTIQARRNDKEDWTLWALVVFQQVYQRYFQV